MDLSLDALGLKHGTDKASSHHDYLSFYETFFAPIRHKNINVLEIGVFNGASLKTWADYFFSAKIVGADIQPSTKRFEDGRIIIELLDQSNIEELTRLALKHGPFDVIIEDGSHMWEHQITSLRTLFPYLNNNGLYIVEDLQTNYGSMVATYKGNASATCVDFLKAWLDLRVADNEIAIGQVEDAFLRTYGRAAEFMVFYRRACLIKKMFLPVSREFSPGNPLFAEGGDGESLKVGLLAHISHRGDIFGSSGFIDLGSDTFTFQGVSIISETLVLEYRVCYCDDKSWSAWVEDEVFAGSKGSSKILCGIAVRLRRDKAKQYALRIFGRFVESSEIVQVQDGEDLISPTGGALCGLQILLTSRF